MRSDTRTSSSEHIQQLAYFKSDAHIGIRAESSAIDEGALERPHLINKCDVTKTKNDAWKYNQPRFRNLKYSIIIYSYYINTYLWAENVDNKKIN